MDSFSLTHVSLVNSKKDILLDIRLDIPRDMYPFSVFGSVLVLLFKVYTVTQHRHTNIESNNFRPTLIEPSAREAEAKILGRTLVTKYFITPAIFSGHIAVSTAEIMDDYFVW